MAPVPPDRAKVPTVRTVWTAHGNASGREPGETDEAFNKRQPWYPKFKTCTTIEELELSKQFVKSDAEKIKEILAEKFDPTRHVILFARWYSWSHQDSLSIGMPVDGDGKVLFQHDCHERERGNDLPVRVKHTFIFVIAKDAKWRVGTVFHDK